MTIKNFSFIRIIIALFSIFGLAVSNGVVAQQVAVSPAVLLNQQDSEQWVRLWTAKDDKTLFVAGDTVYVRHAKAGRYHIVRLGKTHHVADGQWVQGQVLGVAEVLPADWRDDEQNVRKQFPARSLQAVMIEQAWQEVQAGDVLVATLPSAQSIEPTSLSPDFRAEIVNIADGKQLAGASQLLWLNRGAEHGLVQGMNLSVYRQKRGHIRMEWADKGSEATEWLPLAERIGEVEVVYVDAKHSAVVVRHSQQAVEMQDWVAP